MKFVEDDEGWAARVNPGGPFGNPTLLPGADAPLVGLRPTPDQTLTLFGFPVSWSGG